MAVFKALMHKKTVDKNHVEHHEKRSYSTNASDYELLEEIGSGGSATVFRAIYLPYNETVAVKCMDLDRCNANLDNISKEAQTMKLIEHPNVVKAHCSFVVKQELWVVTPFMAQGSCMHLLQSAYPDGLDEAAICCILKETLKALDYLHQHELIHRDVKAGNILVDTNGAVKLADLGVSTCTFEGGKKHTRRHTLVGTPCWMAPEVILSETGYDYKADIWSFGITALELAHGHAPFSEHPPGKVLLMTLQNAPKGLDNNQHDSKFSKSFREMITLCLSKDPAKRPTAEKLLKHSFFKGAKPPERSVKKLFANLPPLKERVRSLELQDVQLLANRAQEAQSKAEYQRGVSRWNFNTEDLRAHVSDSSSGEEDNQGR